MNRWASVLEDFSIKRFQQNAAIGREGFSKVSSIPFLFFITRNKPNVR